MSDGETIRRAAELLEQRARAVIDVVGDDAPWFCAADLDGADADMEVTTEDAAHIAGMSPAFALAVASSLRACGEDLGPGVVDEATAIDSATHIARAYLGDTTA